MATREARQLFREALDGFRQHFGNEHEDTLQSADNLAQMLQSEGELTEAEALYRDTWQRRKGNLGDKHPDALSSASHLAGLYQVQGRFDAAEKLFQNVTGSHKRR